MDKKLDLQQFMDKVKAAESGQKLDLSSGEDLSIGIMNLISIEEHLFFSGGKTGKTKYYDLINEVRAMRVALLKEIIKDYGGEEWCISKHLLAASMRLMEVGTKAQKKGDTAKAYDYFQKSFHLYNLFWGLNLGLVKNKDPKTIELPKNEIPLKTSKGLFSSVSSAVGKMLDCCRE
ncbi:hypothetical protein M1116_04150 [Patescibacteria group bacterium]|nr:hypothetical protein [Patescibacteria group bacterium]